MPDRQHEHGTSVVPVGAYAPGSRLVNPAGLSKGVSVVTAEHIPSKPIERRAVTAQRDRDAHTPPRRRGRPLGSKNLPPITKDMLDAPTDEG